MKLAFTTISLAAMLASAPALAQTQETESGSGVDILTNWSYDPLYQEGRSVNDIIYSADLYGPNGDNIGSIENIIFSDDGTAEALIAEVGGFWDIGDTHVSIPWDQVELGASGGVSVPITEDSVADYSGIYEGYLTMSDTDGRTVVDDDLETGPSVFKATDLIGDYATLSDRTPYGYVNDVLIDANGDISAVVVEANAYGTPGYYAYPYGGYTTPAERNSPYYGMPYDSNQIDRLEQFDYDKLASAQS